MICCSTKARLILTGAARAFLFPLSGYRKEVKAHRHIRIEFDLKPMEMGSCQRKTARIKHMAEPTSVAVPLVIAGVGGGAAAAMAGVDVNAVIMAFAGAAMFAFVSRGTSIPVRIGLLMTAWCFGYYASLEIVQREILGFKTPPLPSFIMAFFCVAVFKALLVIFDKDGQAWIRKRLGLPIEGPKDE